MAWVASIGPAREFNALPSGRIDPVPHVIFAANRHVPLAGAADG